MSPSESLRSATRLSATAPLYAFATLAILMRSSARGRRRVFVSATPAVNTLVWEPRRRVTIAPGGPSSASTSVLSWR